MAVTRVTASYIIAATPRTGSWLLCDCLRQTGVAGSPAEYGIRNDEATWRGYYGFSSHRAYFDQLIPLHVTPNGVFGLKLMWWQLAGLADDARHYRNTGPGVLNAVTELVGPSSVLWVRRRNRLRQAISWVRARQTQRWSLLQQGPAMRARPGEPIPEEPSYDREAIASALDDIEQQESRWGQLLADEAADVLPVFYEDFCADVGSELTRVLEFLGLDCDLSMNPVRPRLQRQADSRTEAWVRRYAGLAGTHRPR
jgi:LPS sulfotransferase NodH